MHRLVWYQIGSTTGLKITSVSSQQSARIAMQALGHINAISKCNHPGLWSSGDHARLKCSRKRNEPVSATKIQDDWTTNAEHGFKKGKIQINSSL
jgi:hypothetical protein